MRTKRMRGGAPLPGSRGMSSYGNEDKPPKKKKKKPVTKSMKDLSLEMTGDPGTVIMTPLRIDNDPNKERDTTRTSIIDPSIMRTPEGRKIAQDHPNGWKIYPGRKTLSKGVVDEMARVSEESKRKKVKTLKKPTISSVFMEDIPYKAQRGKSKKPVRSKMKPGTKPVTKLEKIHEESTLGFTME